MVREQKKASVAGAQKMGRTEWNCYRTGVLIQTPRGFLDLMQERIRGELQSAVRRDYLSKAAPLQSRASSTSKQRNRPALSFSFIEVLSM